MVQVFSVGPFAPFSSSDSSDSSVAVERAGAMPAKTEMQSETNFSQFLSAFYAGVIAAQKDLALPTEAGAASVDISDISSFAVAVAQAQNADHFHEDAVAALAKKAGLYNGLADKLVELGLFEADDDSNLKPQLTEKGWQGFNAKFAEVFGEYLGQNFYTTDFDFAEIHDDLRTDVFAKFQAHDISTANLSELFEQAKNSVAHSLVELQKSLKPIVIAKPIVAVEQAEEPETVEIPKPVFNLTTGKVGAAGGDSFTPAIEAPVKKGMSFNSRLGLTLTGLAAAAATLVTLFPLNRGGDREGDNSPKPPVPTVAEVASAQVAAPVVAAPVKEVIVEQPAPAVTAPTPEAPKPEMRVGDQPDNELGKNPILPSLDDMNPQQLAPEKSPVVTAPEAPAPAVEVRKAEVPTPTEDAKAAGYEVKKAQLATPLDILEFQNSNADENLKATVCKVQKFFAKVGRVYKGNEEVAAAVKIATHMLGDDKHQLNFAYFLNELTNTLSGKNNTISKADFASDNPKNRIQGVTVVICWFSQCFNDFGTDKDAEKIMPELRKMSRVPLFGKFFAQAFYAGLSENGFKMLSNHMLIYEKEAAKAAMANKVNVDKDAGVEKEQVEGARDPEQPMINLERLNDLMQQQVFDTARANSLGIAA